MKLYAFQMDIAWEDKKANLIKVRSVLNETKPVPGSLVVLPEMFATGFSMNASHIMENEGDQTESFLATIARDLGIHLMGGLVRDAGNGRGYNQSVTFSPEGKLVARYTKIQPFSLGGEKEQYDAGDRVVLFDWNGSRVAPFICYDLRFPELFRVATRRGAQILVVIANWPAKRAHHFTALARARAIENQAYMLALNRCGQDPHHPYNGQTILVDPSGDVLAGAGEWERLICAEIDLEAQAALRKGLPFLEDMRHDYEELK